MLWFLTAFMFRVDAMEGWPDVAIYGFMVPVWLEDRNWLAPR